MTTKKNKSFEESMTRLDEIVEALEKNEVPLDEAIKLYEEGMVLLKDCEGQLTDFEKKIESLTQKKDKE